MARQKDLVHDCSATISDAYHVIDSVYVTEKTHIRYNVKSYKDNTKAVELDSQPYEFDTTLEEMDAKNPTALAYSHYKTTEDGQGGTDV